MPRLQPGIFRPRAAPSGLCHGLTQHGLSYHIYQAHHRPGEYRKLWVFTESARSLPGVVDFSRVDASLYLGSQLARNFVYQAHESVLGVEKGVVTEIQPSQVLGFLDPFIHHYDRFVNLDTPKAQYSNFMVKAREYTFPSDWKHIVADAFYTEKGSRTNGLSILSSSPFVDDCYVLRVAKSKIYHVADCAFVRCSLSKVMVLTRKEALDRGYTECKRCATTAVYLDRGTYHFSADCDHCRDMVPLMQIREVQRRVQAALPCEACARSLLKSCD